MPYAEGGKQRKSLREEQDIVSKHGLMCGDFLPWDLLGRHAAEAVCPDGTVSARPPTPRFSAPAPFEAARGRAFDAGRFTRRK